MSRDRKGSPSVSPSESSEAWRDAGKLFPRRAVSEGSARREARPDRKGVHAHVLRKPGLLR